MGIPVEFFSELLTVTGDLPITPYLKWTFIDLYWLHSGKNIFR